MHSTIKSSNCCPPAILSLARLANRRTFTYLPEPQVGSKCLIGQRQSLSTLWATAHRLLGHPTRDTGAAESVRARCQHRVDERLTVIQVSLDPSLVVCQHRTDLQMLQMRSASGSFK